MDTKEILQVKWLCFEKPEYTIDEVKEYISYMTSKPHADKIITLGKQMGLELKESVPACDLFKIVCLWRFIQDEPRKSTNGRYLRWKIKQLDQYLN
jgi:hypothetical protein